MSNFSAKGGSIMGRQFFKTNRDHIKKKQRGFTLIEVLVATAIFTLAVLAVAGIFTATVNAQRKVINMEYTKGSANFMLESMTKEVRMSTVESYSDSALTITDPDGNTVTYSFNSSDKEFLRNSLPMHPDGLAVTGSFFVQRSPISPIRYKVVIMMNVKVKNTKSILQSAIDLQTAVTPRGPQR